MAEEKNNSIFGKTNSPTMSNSILDVDFSKGNYKYAKFLERVAASIIDMVIFIPLIAVTFYNTMDWKNLGLAILLILIGFLYKPLMEYYYGATLGKMAMKIKVLDTGYDEITMGQSFTRAFPWIISTIVNLLVTYLMFQDPDFYDADGFFAFSQFSQEFGPSVYNNYAAMVLFLSIFFMFWEKRKQTLHDKVANTVVVKMN